MSVWKSIKDTVSQSVKVSQKALREAASKTKGLKDISVLRLEVRDRQTKRNKLCCDLGKAVYDKFLGVQTLGRGNPVVKELLVSIGAIDKEIVEKQNQIKKLAEKKKKK